MLTKIGEIQNVRHTIEFKEFTSFDFTASLNTDLDTDVIGVIDEDNKTVDLLVPYNTPLTSLTASFTVSGGTVSIGAVQQDSGITANDFTGTVIYRVTAVDTSYQDYTVIVTSGASYEKAITQFKFTSALNAALSSDVNGTINETDKTISATVPYNTDVTSLIATFSTTGASIEVSGVVQETDVTANNFTVSLIYRVFADDTSSADYTVTVSITPPATTKAVTGFKFLSSLNGAISSDTYGIIDEASKTIDIYLTTGTSVNSLIATFTITGVEMSISGTPQTSSSTSNDFSSSVIYTVTAEDASTADYTVTIYFTYLTDLFEDPDLSNWNPPSGTSTPTVVSPGADGTGSCLEITGYSSSGSGLSMNFPNIQPLNISFYVKVTSTSYHQGYMIVYDSASNYVIWFYSQASTGMIRLVNSSAPDIPVTLNKWYFVEFKNFNWTTKTFDYYLDSTLIKAGASIYNTLATDVAKVEVLNLSGSATSKAYWDEIIVE